MSLRLPLRWRIVVVFAPVLAALSFASAALVNRGIEAQVHERLRDELRDAASVFENILAVRSTELRVAGGVIAHDPRFFSVITLPAVAAEPMARATVAGVARDFDRLTQADLFEVVDDEGRLVTSVGRARSSAAAREALVRSALAGEVVDGVLAEPGAHYQVVVTPVTAGDRTVGALLLGTEVGPALAHRLRRLTRAEVTFVSAGHTTGSTLAEPADRAAAANTVATLGLSEDTPEPDVQLVRGAHETWLTRVGTIPHAPPGARDSYLLQRSLDRETAFLRDIRGRLTALGAAGALLVVLASLAIASRVTVPLERLVRAATEMERGRYDFPLEVRTGDELGYLASRFDDMRRKQRELVTRLEDTARVKSEFIAVASHELRTPVSVIGGFQQLLRDGSLGPVTPGQSQALEAIGRSCAMLGRLAEDATRMAQFEEARDALSLADADLASVLEAAVRGAKEAAPGRAVELSWRLEPGLDRVWADPTRLEQAVSQLVRNGIRFTPDGGRVDVRAGRADGAVRIDVQDTGVGLSEERQQRLFERGGAVRDSLNHHSSLTLEFNSAGLGLGLALARGVAEAHGGRLQVHSVEGQGSTFTIVLPDAATRGASLAA